MGMPWETMMRAVTMKMIKSTSVTSTSGVTLMPAIKPSSSLLAPPAIAQLSSAFALVLGPPDLGAGAMPASTPAK